MLKSTATQKNGSCPGDGFFSGNFFVLNLLLDAEHNQVTGECNDSVDKLNLPLVGSKQNCVETLAESLKGSNN